MDKREKQNKRSIIAAVLDLAGARLKDSEVNTLFNIVSTPENYDGKTRTIEKSFTSWFSDGKYRRKESTTYTILADDSGLRIEEDYAYHDDDGQRGGSKVIHTSARAILRLLSSIFGL